MSDWRINGIEDDVRSRMFERARCGQAFALATIVAADGGPRPVGSQMVITADDSWGFLSGGCIEDDVARHGRAVLLDGHPQRFVYGMGSPFIDIRLPCGGKLEVLVERISADDGAIRALDALTQQRCPAVWSSNGRERACGPETSADGVSDPQVRRLYTPCQRLLVVGTDPVALTLAALGTSTGWETTLVAPFGPSAPAPFDLACDRRPLSQSLAASRLDRWTAVAVATHEMEADEDALVAALASDAGYVGVLGSRRKLDERKAGLRAAGLSARQIDRLHAPIGLDIGAGSPWEVAVAVVAQVIQERPRHAMTGLRSTKADAFVGA